LIFYWFIKYGNEAENGTHRKWTIMVMSWFEEVCKETFRRFVTLKIE
jgi:hypothetical protein